jgi:6-phosphogluconolactonase/glucosamine-6-phosphate isomerase/deaminase
MFNFKPAAFVPYKNNEVLERCRNIKREDMEKHPNPDFRIHIVPSPDGIWIGDMVARMMRSDLCDEKLVMILPNPCPVEYESVAEAVNRLNINCRNVHVFMMDEWADEDGNVAPITWKSGFGYSNLTYFYGKIREDLRMPLDHMHYFTTENVKDYSKLIAECGDGGADICYSGPGWAGHIAFIDPDTPEFACSSLDEFINMGARIVTLNPMTVMQNSLHGTFGCSGDIANVPPRAATIGPADVKRSRNRLEMHAITTMGSYSSWQRMTSRLVCYGEVTPQVPSSVLQLWDTDVYVSEEIAKPFECMEKVGY